MAPLDMAPRRVGTGDPLIVASGALTYRWTLIFQRAIDGVRLPVRWLSAQFGGTMLCHECLMEGDEGPSVAMCEYCKVFLCKSHLMALYRAGARQGPFSSCGHDRAGAPRMRARPRDLAHSGPTMTSDRVPELAGRR